MKAGLKMNNRLHRCCFAGDNPAKLDSTEEAIKAKLRIQIHNSIIDGYKTFITGMDPGVDIWAAEVVLEMKSRYDVKLICAVPYPGFGKTKDYQRNLHYKRVIERADLVREISSSCNEFCFQKRNQWMADHSAKLIAVYNGSPDDIKSTIDYAIENSVDVKHINLR